MAVDRDAVVALVDHRIRTTWPGDRVTSARGLVHIPQVKVGGTTDLLIKMASEIAVDIVLDQVRRAENVIDGDDDLPDEDVNVGGINLFHRHEPGKTPPNSGYRE